MEFQLQHEYSNEYSGLISFRIDWFDLLAVQGSLKSLLQHHSSKASILWPFSLFHCLALTSAYIAGDLGLIPGLVRFPWRREWLSTPVFWLGEFHRLSRPWDRKESGTTE